MNARNALATLTVAALLAPAMVDAQERRAPATRNADADRQMRFRAMDADNDGVITRDEWRGNDQSFREHDTNDDGVLSGDEVWVPAARDEQAQDRSRRDERLARFARADRNRDGRISFREWTGSETMFDRMDRDGDEFISRAEFMAAAVDRPAGTAGSRDVIESQERTPAYQAGYQKGLEEGRQAGREDKNVNGGKWDLEGQRELEQADSGYRNELGTRTDYQAGYRAGFRLGYGEGFGPRR